MSFCANARWGKFFKFGEIFEKLLTLKFFLMGNNKKIFLDENILLYVNDLICSLGESITLLHFLYFFHH